MTEQRPNGDAFSTWAFAICALLAAVILFLFIARPTELWQAAFAISGAFAMTAILLDFREGGKK